ncbi:OLC1v1010132C5 [Oldenlandia corymbosa var. corymbosa]|nr:OLC1v1010132C5 [Oldenlandia corymbosa var. corymbosa]
MTLRYLISIHKWFCIRQGVLSPVSDLTERLLLEERDFAPIPPESAYEAPPFDEVDIQALAHAVELTRQGAVDSLKFAKGDLFQAFQNELCRMRLDVSMLDELVYEYCIYRGIVDSAPAAHPGSCSSQNNVIEGDCGSIKAPDGELSHGNANLNGSNEGQAHFMTTHTKDIVERYPSGTSNCQELCSTSGTYQPCSLKVQQKNRNKGCGERNKRKRWRGRHEEIECITEVISGCNREETEASSVMGSLSHGDDRYEMLLAIKELACRGMAAEVVEEINVIDPNFFSQNPDLLFQLKQVEFLKLVSSGDHPGALRVASSHLGPLAASEPSLLRPLKETLVTLLRPNEEAYGEFLPLHALASSVQVAIGRRLGIEEPQLMKIMKATLYTHNEWFKLQMCKDRFQGLLQINSLKEVSPSLLAEAALRSNDSSLQGSSTVTTSSSSKAQEDTGSPTQTSSADVACDENAILKVMEFLALPRADAIHLLTQYNGNAEIVIQQLFP